MASRAPYVVRSLASAGQAARQLLPRAGGVTWGRTQGIFHSIADPRWRATHNDPEVMQAISRDGYRSPAMRAGNPPRETEPTDEEIAEYSGIEGQPANYRDSDLVGVNRNLAHTVDVAQRTGRNANLQSPGTLVQEVLPEGLRLHSVAAAFARSQLRNRHPVQGEEVAANHIPPQNTGHTAVFPLDHPAQQEQLGQPGQVHPDYLRNIGMLAEEDGASASSPLSIAIRTALRDHPDGSGRNLEIDHLSFGDGLGGHQ